MKFLVNTESSQELSQQETGGKVELLPYIEPGASFSADPSGHDRTLSKFVSRELSVFDFHS